MLQLKSKGKSDLSDTLKQTVWKRPVKIRVDCKTVRIFAYSSTLYAWTVKQKLKTESETGERR